MIKLHEKYVTDSRGKKSGILLSLNDYNKIVRILEEYEDIKDFDERISDPKWLSFDEFKKRLNV